MPYLTPCRQCYDVYPCACSSGFPCEKHGEFGECKHDRNAGAVFVPLPAESFHIPAITGTWQPDEKRFCRNCGGLEENHDSRPTCCEAFAPWRNGRLSEQELANVAYYAHLRAREAASPHVPWARPAPSVPVSHKSAQALADYHAERQRQSAAPAMPPYWATAGCRVVGILGGRFALEPEAARIIEVLNDGKGHTRAEIWKHIKRRDDTRSVRGVFRTADGLTVFDALVTQIARSYQLKHTLTIF